IVVICLPSAEATGSTQERTALPSRCTVQAPHIATPQPYLVPVRPTCSRIAQRRGVLGSTLTSSDLPLIVKRAMVFPPGVARNIRGQAAEHKRVCDGDRMATGHRRCRGHSCPGALSVFFIDEHGP